MSAPTYRIDDLVEAAGADGRVMTGRVVTYRQARDGRQALTIKDGEGNLVSLVVDAGGAITTQPIRLADAIRTAQAVAAAERTGRRIPAQQSLLAAAVLALAVGGPLDA